MNRVGCLIYSKDRPMQLDLLIRSMQKYFINRGPTVVIYKCSNEEYRKGYDKVIEKWEDFIHFCDEDDSYEGCNNFKETLIRSLEYLKNSHVPYFLGLCDDDVFIKECKISNDMLYELDNLAVNAISIKSGLNITHHYPNIVVKQPSNFIQIEPYLMWSWLDQPRPTDWGYPTCINSYIYNIDYYLSILNEIEFNHPTVLEATCNTVRNLFRPIMVGTKETCLLNIPCNRLQTVNDTPFGEEYAFTTKELNDKWLEGYEIDTSNIFELKVDRPNLDIALTFKKEK